MSLASLRAAAKAKAEAARANPKPRAKPRAKPEKRLGTGPKPPGYAGVGRPTEYSPELAEKIAEQIALRVPMVKICADIGVSEAAVYNWKRRYPEFVELVARAREFRAEARADQIDQYIEDLKSGKLDPNVGRTIILAEQWQASKENKRYGDRMAVTGADGKDLIPSASASLDWLRKVLDPPAVLPLQLEAQSASASEEPKS